jgi:hypothetical protein
MNVFYLIFSKLYCIFHSSARVVTVPYFLPPIVRISLESKFDFQLATRHDENMILWRLRIRIALFAERGRHGTFVVKLQRLNILEY